ncbi:ABC transporter ATP-binding protein [Psychrobium sp. 1_MG-2023]|uniref:ABC transporter ATP-binding protein n=1 Tax=Psychrobium sp. 1_MG-2023 TaxID=3062624 RepID=UPI000C32B58F|nr:ABC transporter ATP-binding protein [Psychrobium sp. 1_MG-2023]MDP2561839.1 ABC transporter ATP-binding protein [Psychrobium sp. 1_MG-2023]PKF55790.1 ABC transporter ATP-binding protein [Alteromonadales bacterium alter-6D02]
MIKIDKLSKSFAGNLALNNLNLTVKEQSVTCLLGENGAGKSTTLNLILNFISPDSGTITVDGIDTQKQPQKSKEKLIYLPENINLYLEFNALENLSYLAKLTGESPSTNDIEQALRQTGLQESAWQEPLSNYSKGMRQKVGIALAIIRKAKILLLDEPTSGLDPSATLEFIRVIKMMVANGAAVLMVTHDLHCAHALADQIGIMKQGSLCDLFETQYLSMQDVEYKYHHHIIKPIESQHNAETVLIQAI